jgi:hypothetical protein
MKTWHSIIKRVLKMPPHESIIVPIDEVPDPEKEGAVRTIGEYKGQEADYEFTLDERRIHIRKYKDHYEVHWDKVSPLVNPIEHLRQDAPYWWSLLCGIGNAGLRVSVTYLIRKFLGKKYYIEDILIDGLSGFCDGIFLGLSTCNNK